MFTNMNKGCLSKREANGYSPLGLAFLGDSVYDTLVRDYLLRRANMPVAKLHAAKVRLVCAEFQSDVYELLSERLTDEELAVLKRGRNATGNTVPKHAEAVQYRRATAVEALFGYLYITGEQDRILELFQIITDELIINDREEQA